MIEIQRGVNCLNSKGYASATTFFPYILYMYYNLRPQNNTVMNNNLPW